MTEENEQRMERLFHDHYEQMYRFAFALLHDNEEARDVVSDVFSRSGLPDAERKECLHQSYSQKEER